MLLGIRHAAAQLAQQGSTTPSTKCTSAETNSAVGYSYTDDHTIDDTEGLGAFHDIRLQPNTRNIDVGGGKFDTNINYLKHKYQVTNRVYDPFNRSKEHNLAVLQESITAPFDTATSISVMNVIKDKADRVDHVRLTFDCIKPGGVAYFKVFAGNGSGQEDVQEGTYQSNRGAESYADEVAQIYGRSNVHIFKHRHLLVATKPQSR
eukprot:jgi/Chrzof1/5677/Cz16g11110.t1